MDERLLHASSFGAAAVEYAEHRAARFGSPEQAEFPQGQRRTAGSLATRAGMLVKPEPERRATLDRIRAFLASTPDTAHGEFTLPMLTGVLRVRETRPASARDG